MAFKFQMTVPQQTQFSPAVLQKNAVKYASKAAMQTVLTLPGDQVPETSRQDPTSSKKRSATPPHLPPPKHEKTSHMPHTIGAN
jgi:hypothetical protein